MQIPKRVFDSINEILADKSLSKDLRNSYLDEAAQDAWNAIFPEGAHRITEAVAKQRWAAVHTQLSVYPNREQIMRILESPATGEWFHWLDSTDVR